MGGVLLQSKEPKNFRAFTVDFAAISLGHGHHDVRRPQRLVVPEALDDFVHLVVGNVHRTGG